MPYFIIIHLLERFVNEQSVVCIKLQKIGGMKMKIETRYACKSDCFKTNKKIIVKGIMLHSVGCNQPKAEVFLNQWNKAGVNVCPHGVIDGLTDGLVIQTLPWEHRGWHGGGTSNSTHIGIEMCEPDTIKYTHGAVFTVQNKERAVVIARRTYNTAVELFAYLCKKYALNPMKRGVIVSHNEGYKLGIASGHVDPEHFWTGLGLDYTMDKFRADVRAKMEMEYSKNGKIEEKEDNLSSSKKSLNTVAKEVIVGKWGNGADRKKRLEQAGYDYAAVQKIVDRLVKGTYGENKVENKEGFKPYLVKVLSATQIYKDESAKKVVGEAKAGVYTIIKEANGLGLLKSKAGWIKLGREVKTAG